MKVKRRALKLRTTGQAKCSSLCGEVFSSRSNFDLHLKPLSEGGCKPPRSVGLVWSDRGWKQPEVPPDQRWWENLGDSEESEE